MFPFLQIRVLSGRINSESRTWKFLLLYCGNLFEGPMKIVPAPGEYSFKNWFTRNVPSCRSGALEYCDLLVPARSGGRLFIVALMLAGDSEKKILCREGKKVGPTKMVLRGPWCQHSDRWNKGDTCEQVSDGSTVARVWICIQDGHTPFQPERSELTGVQHQEISEIRRSLMYFLAFGWRIVILCEWNRRAVEHFSSSDRQIPRSSRLQSDNCGGKRIHFLFNVIILDWVHWVYHFERVRFIVQYNMTKGAESGVQEKGSWCHWF
jgi:hypothetical protein